MGTGRDPKDPRIPGDPGSVMSQCTPLCPDGTCNCYTNDGYGQVMGVDPGHDQNARRKVRQQYYHRRGGRARRRR